MEAPWVIDAIVIGGGPAGSVAAMQIAARGHSVLVLERHRFPRFHIGESMLPYMAGLLDRMGLLEVAKHQGYVPKRGAEFTGQNGEFFRIEFTAQGPNRMHETFQLERSHFDRMLLGQARLAGAAVVHNANVTQILVENDRVVGVKYVTGEVEHEARANYVVDASGRIGKIANKFGLRRTVDKLRMVAVYRHYGDLDERENPGSEGDIQIGDHPDGWLWAIPIWADTISIGTVMPKSVFRDNVSPETVFEDHLSRIPRINERLRGTTPLTDLRVETDYCYYTDTITGPGWFIVGDAGCFVDPLFSGGVHLAMTTGYQAGAAVADALASSSDEQAIQKAYTDFYKTGYDTYFRLDYSFYECACNFEKYLESLPDGISVHWVARLLCGDFWSADNPLAAAQRENRRWDTFGRPFDMSGVCPIYESDAASLGPGVLVKDVLAQRETDITSRS